MKGEKGTDQRDDLTFVKVEAKLCFALAALTELEQGGETSREKSERGTDSSVGSPVSSFAVATC